MVIFNAWRHMSELFYLFNVMWPWIIQSNDNNLIWCYIKLNMHIKKRYELYYPFCYKWHRTIFHFSIDLHHEHVLQSSAYLYINKGALSYELVLNLISIWRIAYHRTNEWYYLFINDQGDKIKSVQMSLEDVKIETVPIIVPMIIILLSS